MAFVLTPEREQQVDDILTRYPERRASLLPMLWLCQRQNGWISPEVVDYVSQRLDLSTAIVRGVVTFYTMFFDQPVGENVVWVCRTLSCDLRGGKAIQDHLETRHMSRRLKAPGHVEAGAEGKLPSYALMFGPRSNQ